MGNTGPQWGNSSSNYNSSYAAVFTFLTEISPVTTAQSVIELLVFVLAMLCGVAGNVAVLVAVAVDPRLHTATNYLIANQAASDLVYLTGVPSWAANRWLGLWPAGDWLCKANVYVQYVGSTVSINSHCVIAVERLRSISRNRGVAMTMKQTAICAMALWVVSLSLSAMIVPYSGMQFIEVGGRRLTYCHVDGPFNSSTKGGLVVAYLVSCISFLGPVTFLFLVYTKIIRLVRQSLQRMSRHRATTSGSRAVTLERRLVLMLMLSAILFFVMWSPSIVVSALTMGHHYQYLSSTLLAAVTVTGTINTTVNPILLIVFNAFFKDDLRSFFKGTWCKAFRKTGEEQQKVATVPDGGMAVGRVFPLRPMVPRRAEYSGRHSANEDTVRCPVANFRAQSFGCSGASKTLSEAREDENKKKEEHAYTGDCTGTVVAEVTSMFVISEKSGTEENRRHDIATDL